MKQNTKVFFTSLVVLSSMFLAVPALASIAPQVQTNPATNVQPNSVTLNGLLIDRGSYGATTVYFQWGGNTSYGNQTQPQFISEGQSFSQTISNLAQNTTYHFRAVVDAPYGYGQTFGQDITFYTSGSGSSYNPYNYNGLAVNKQVINLTAGNLNWSKNVNANPGDVLSFSISLQAYDRDFHNLLIRDILPANLTYIGNETINTSQSYSGGIISSGISINTLHANQPVVVAYQVQVAPATSFVYGTTTMTSTATVTSTDTSVQSSSSTVAVNRSLVYGASSVATGLTNKFLTDSLFLPLLMIALSAWLYFSGKIYKFADWMKISR